MPRVVHFELAVDDPERATRFYTDVFGWKIEKWQGPVDYYPVTTGAEGEPGINGALNPRSQQQHPWVNVITVDAIDDAIAKVTAAGGKITHPKDVVPGVGYVAYFTDTEGNPVGIFQDDTTVAVPVGEPEGAVSRG